MSVLFGSAPSVPSPPDCGIPDSDSLSLYEASDADSHYDPPPTLRFHHDHPPPTPKPRTPTQIHLRSPFPATRIHRESHVPTTYIHLKSHIPTHVHQAPFRETPSNRTAVSSYTSRFQTSVASTVPTSNSLVQDTHGRISEVSPSTQTAAVTGQEIWVYDGDGG